MQSRIYQNKQQVSLRQTCRHTMQCGFVLCKIFSLLRGLNLTVWLYFGLFFLRKMVTLSKEHVDRKSLQKGVIFLSTTQ